jgi:prepilin-type N-terminal cleavage/methylation domain-containing protein
MPAPSRIGGDGRRGFTLLEVAVAMAVLGLILVSMMQTISGGLTLEYKAGRVGHAVLRARALMDELLTTLEIRDGVEENVDEDGLRWRRAIRKATVEEGGADEADEHAADRDYELRHLEVIVAWSEGEGEKTYALESLRVTPVVE